MSSPTTRAGTGTAWLRPVLWIGLAVGTAFVASVLVGVSVPVLLGTSVTRAGMDVAGVACVGSALVAVLLPLGGATRSPAAARDAVRVQETADRALVLFAGSWMVLVVLGVVFRTADAFGSPLGRLGAGEVLAWSTRLAAGRGMLLTAGCAAVVLGCAVVRLRDPERLQVRIPLVAALLGVLTPAVTGHAGSAPNHQLAVITVALHVAAAALWVGGLAGLLVLLGRRRELLDAALPRFSRLAGGCLVAVALTGVLNALVRLESWGALLTTGYGWLVVAKAVFLVLLGVLGGLARRRLATGRTSVLRWAGLETALMAVTLGLAAALTQTG